MSRDARLTLTLALMLCVCGCLLYLDWRRQGEIELLHERVDRLERPTPIAVKRDDWNAKEPTLTERLLWAPDDRTLADIARENA